MSIEATLTLIQWAVIIQVVVLFFWARNLSGRVDYLSTQIIEQSDLLKAQHTIEKNGDAYPSLVILNTTELVMEISVEVYPDRYILKPGEEMTIEADPEGTPFTIQPFDGGLQIYPGNTAGVAVGIDGKLVKPDWDTPVEKAE